MIKIDKLNPFGRMCLSMGMIPSSYKESLTYEEQLLWFCKFLDEEVIPAINNEGLAIEELQNLYTQLKDYVDNYFENLDVQEEINNKLDEMAESGELTDIIAQYLGLAGVLAYDTISDMSDALNIANGSICYCLGQNDYNDSKGGFYKVRTITSGDIVDGYNIVALDVSDTLIAERITTSLIEIVRNTVNDMITDTTLKNGDIVKTLGFYTKGDSGNASYKIRNITNEDDPDEATLFTLANENLVAELIVENGTINALQIGAKGDNSTDNIDILNAGFNYLEKLNGGTLFIPTGTFIITNTIKIPSNCTLLGVGSSSIIKSSSEFVSTSTYKAMITPKTMAMTTTETNSERNVNIKNLTLNNNGISDSAHDGTIQFRGVVYGSIENVNITVAGDNCWGINLFSANKNILINNCNIDNISDDNSLGGCLWVRSGLESNNNDARFSYAINITNCTFTTTAKDEIVCFADGIAGGHTEANIYNCTLIGKATTNYSSFALTLNCVGDSTSYLKANVSNLNIFGKFSNYAIVSGFTDIPANCTELNVSNINIHLDNGGGLRSYYKDQLFSNCNIYVPTSAVACYNATLTDSYATSKVEGCYVSNTHIKISDTTMGCENCPTVDNCFIETKGYGIHSYGAFSSLIRNNRIKSNNSAIMLQQNTNNLGANEVIIEGNHLSRLENTSNTGTFGIKADYSKFINVTNNIITGVAGNTSGNYYGFQYMTSFSNATDKTEANNSLKYLSA